MRTRFPPGAGCIACREIKCTDHEPSSWVRLYGAWLALSRSRSNCNARRVSIQLWGKSACRPNFRPRQRALPISYGHRRRVKFLTGRSVVAKNLESVKWHWARKYDWQRCSP